MNKALSPKDVCLSMLLSLFLRVRPHKGRNTLWHATSERWQLTDTWAQWHRSRKTSGATCCKANAASSEQQRWERPSCCLYRRTPGRPRATASHETLSTASVHACHNNTLHRFAIQPTNLHCSTNNVTYDQKQTRTKKTRKGQIQKWRCPIAEERVCANFTVVVYHLHIMNYPHGNTLPLCRTVDVTIILWVRNKNH